MLLFLSPDGARGAGGPADAGIAESLQSRLERERKIASEPQGKRLLDAALMNPVRRRMYEHVCRRPFSPLSDAARAVSLGINSAKWHAKMLERAGYIGAERGGKMLLLYPKGMLDDALHKTLASVASLRAGGMLSLVLEQPGITSGEIARELGIAARKVSPAARALAELGLVAAVRDGRYVRLYSSEKAVQMRKMSASRMRGFRAWLVRKVSQDGLQPAVLRADGTALIVQIRAGREKKTLNIRPGLGIGPGGDGV